MTMNQIMTFAVCFASVLLVLPSLVYADIGSTIPNLSHREHLQMTLMTCQNSFFTGYLNDVVTSINNPATTFTITNTDIPKIKNDLNIVQVDTNANNTSLFKIDVKTLQFDLSIANKDASSSIKSAKNTSLGNILIYDIGQLKSTYKTCISSAIQSN